MKTYSKTGKMKETRMRCIKYLLFFMNLIFSVSGLVLVVAGVVIQSAYSQYLDFLGHNFSTPVFLIILGVIIFSVSFFGCCGAINESHCMTLTFAWLLGIIFLLEVVVGVTAYNLRSQLGGLVEENMEAGMGNFMRSGYKGVTETWNVLQHEFSCCGVVSYQDWLNTSFSLSTSSVPDSCCVYDVVGCGRDILLTGARIYRSGCLDSLSNMVRDNVAMVGGTVIAIAFIQFVVLIFSVCLATNIRLGYHLL